MSNGLRWTAERAAEHQKKVGASLDTPPAVVLPRAPVRAKGTPEEVVRRADALARFQALGRMPKEHMNDTEREYADRLERMRLVGEIIDWKFHPMNVRLAQRTFYEVDFLVLHADMRVAIHETKGGFTTEKGQMKIKLCAEALPWFLFYKATKLTKKQGGGWKIEEF